MINALSINAIAHFQTVYFVEDFQPNVVSQQEKGGLVTPFGAERSQTAGRATRITCRADISPMQDEPVMSLGAFVGRDVSL